MIGIQNSNFIQKKDINKYFKKVEEYQKSKIIIQVKLQISKKKI